MNPGKLDRRVTLQARTETQDALGAPVVAFEDVATVWASYAPQGSREFTKAGGTMSTATAIFTIRFLAGITTGHRLLFNGQPYGIESITEQGRRELLVIGARTLSNPAAVK